MTTALIDGDILVYKAACGVEKPVRWPDGVWTYSASEQTGIEVLDGLIKGVLETLKTDDYVICLSDDDNNFRKDLYPQYKENRTDNKKPLLLQFLKDHAKKHYISQLWEGLEADDIMGILATRGGYDDPVIVTTDKDLGQIPVKTFNPDTQEMSKPEHREPYRFFMTQVLTGDQIDNYPGCPGFGIKSVEKLFKDREDSELWGLVVKQYEKKGLTKQDAITQARCAYILQANNYENDNLKLWGENFG